MKRAKLAVIFAAALTVLAISAIPASAWFEALKGTSGTATAGPSILETNGSGNVVCTKAEGAWVIETTGKQEEQFEPNAPGQKPTKQGPHQTFFISKWNNCAASGGAGSVPAVASPCILQIVQPVKGNAISGVYGSVGSVCAIKIVAGTIKCEINVPPAGNEVLTTATVSKISSTETQSYPEVTNLTSTVSSECAALGIEGGKKGKFKNTTTAVNEILV